MAIWFTFYFEYGYTGNYFSNLWATASTFFFFLKMWVQLRRIQMLYLRKKKTWRIDNIFDVFIGKIIESESGSIVFDSLWSHGLYSPWNSPGQNAGVGSLSLLQGIFPTQGSNLGLLHSRQIFLPAEPQEKPRIIEWNANWVVTCHASLLHVRCSENEFSIFKPLVEFIIAVHAAILEFFWKHIQNIDSVLSTFIHARSDQIRSVAQSCPTLCNPMNRSTPGLPVHHQLPEFTQTHVHRVGDAIQPSHGLSSPSPPAPNPSQHQSLFQWVNSSHEVAKVLEFQL